MNTKEWDAAQDKFWLTRLQAKTAFKKWKREEALHGNTDRVIYYMHEYGKAWQAYQEANMSLFLIECENEK